MTIGSRRRITRELLFEVIPAYRDAASIAAAERMFERDKADILALGFDLRTETDAWDESIVHYRIHRPERDRVIPVTREQYTVLLAASRAWDEATAGGAARRVRAKLLSLGLEPDEDLLRVAPEARLESLPSLSPLLQAVEDRRAVRFAYRRADGTLAQREVEPWDVAVVAGHWYLLAHDRDRADERVFRVSRIESFPRDFAGAAHPRPERASVVARMRDGVGQEVREVRLDVAPEKALALRDQVGADALAQKIDLGERAHADAVALVLADSRWLTLVEPAEWRRELAEVLESVASLHASPADDLPDAAGAQRPAPRIRVTPSAGDRLSRLVSEVSYVVARGEVPVEAMAADFGITEAQLVEDLRVLYLCGDLGGGWENLIEAHWEDGWVRVANADALATSLRLTGPETTALLAGLSALEPADAAERALIDSARRALLGEQDEEGATAEPAAESDAAPETRPARGETVARRLRDAIARGGEVTIRYSPPELEGTMRRRVRPRQLAAVDGRGYVQVDDLTPGVDGAVRRFRLDRLVEVDESPAPVPPIQPDLHAPVEDAWIRVAPEAAWIADSFAAAEVRDVAPADDGSPRSLVRIGSPVRAAVLDAVIEAKGAAELLRPAAWRELVHEAAAGAARRHRRNEPIG